MYATTWSLLRSLTVTAQYDGFHKCPPHSSCFNSGCERNNWRARFPFIIFIMSDIKNCGLQSRSKWIWSGITSIARILNLYSSASPYNIFLHSASIPFFRTCFRYFVHQTRWYCKEYTYPLPYESVFLLIVNISFSMFILYHMPPHLANASSVSW